MNTNDLDERTFPRKCFNCGNAWGKCTCEDVSEEDGFLHCSTIITNPFVSECARYFVNPFLYYGDNYRQWLASNKEWLLIYYGSNIEKEV